MKATTDIAWSGGKIARGDTVPKDMPDGVKAHCVRTKAIVEDKEWAKVKADQDKAQKEAEAEAAATAKRLAEEVEEATKHMFDEVPCEDPSCDVIAKDHSHRKPWPGRAKAREAAYAAAKAKVAKEKADTEVGRLEKEKQDAVGAAKTPAPGPRDDA